MDSVLNMEMSSMLITLAFGGLFTVVAVLAIALVQTRRKSRPFQVTFDTASVGLVHVALDGTWLLANNKMTEITGYEREELARMRFADVTVEEDLQKNHELNTKLRSGEIDSYTLEKRYLRKDKSIIWAKLSVTLVRKKDGKPDYYVSAIEDIDELKRAEFALQEQEARFRAFWDNSPFNQSIKDRQGRLVDVNNTYLSTFGIQKENFRGKSLDQAHGTKWSSGVDDFDREVLRTMTTRTSDVTVPGKDNDDLLIRVTKFPISDREGRVVGVGGISYDITSQVRAAQQMRDSEERFRATFEQAAVGIAHVSIDGQWLRMNQRYCDILGYSEEELRHLTFRDITHSQDLEADIAIRNELLNAGRGSYTNEKRYIRKGGTPVWIKATASITEPSRYREPYLIVVVEDITARKEAEQSLAIRLDQQSAVMAIGQMALVEGDLETLLSEIANMVAVTLDVDICLISKMINPPTDFQIIAANMSGEKFVGVEVRPKTPDEERSFSPISSKSVIFDNRDPENPDLTSPITDDIGTLAGVTVVIAEGDSTFGMLAVHSSRFRDFTGDDVTFLQAVANVVSTAIVRNRITDELSDRERTLDAILDNAADGIVVYDARGNIVMANDAAEDIFGYETARLTKMQIRDLVPATYPSKNAHAAHDFEIQTSAREMVGRRADGSSVPIDIAMSEFDGPDGSLHIALVRDITEQKSMQSQLIQASKLATVGEMAAGIAHELNQPLNIMRMAADNVLIRMDTGNIDMDYVRDNLVLVSEQAGRMGKIILHMRVFSRQDTSDFVPFDPARPTRNACELMRRQLQLESIELNLDVEMSDYLVEGSESQLEQVIINMITNARDAIQEHSIEATAGSRGVIDVTGRSHPSDATFIVKVRDNGGGIPGDVLARVFDPFFTTKEVGIGTGLGLSVSYGIISSMGGSITAHNTGDGCEMCIELPLSAEHVSNSSLTKVSAPKLQ